MASKLLFPIVYCFISSLDFEKLLSYRYQTKRKIKDIKFCLVLMEQIKKDILKVNIIKDIHKIEAIDFYTFICRKLW